MTREELDKITYDYQKAWVKMKKQKAEMKDVPKLRIVSKEEFEKFIKEYPRHLEKDYFMDKFSWNDFSNGKKWPESIVAMCSDGIYGMPIEYKILNI